MGVDLETYRGRIGTYRHSNGQDVIIVTCVINFSSGLKTVGAVLFIGVLLLIAGIESNPGPGGAFSSYLFTSIFVVISGLILQITEWQILAFYLMCLLLVVGLFLYGKEPNTQTERKEVGSQTEDDNDQSGVQLPASLPLKKTKSNNSETPESFPEHSETSSNSVNEGLPQVPSPAETELYPSASSVLQNSRDQSEASRNPDNEGLPQVPSPANPESHLSTLSVLQKTSEQSEASSNSDNEGVPQVLPPAHPELFLSTSSALQKNPEQSEAEQNSDEEGRPQVSPPVAPVLQSTSSVMESAQRSSEQSRSSSSNPDNEGLPQVPSPANPESHLSTLSVLQKTSEQSEASSNSDNEGVPQVLPPAHPELFLSTSSVLQKNPEQSEAEQNSDEEGRPQVSPPVAPVLQSTSSVMESAQRSSEQSRASSSNPDNEGLPQVPSPANPESHLSTLSVLQKTSEQSEASSNSDNEGVPQVLPPAHPELFLSTSSVLQKNPEQSEAEQNSDEEGRPQVSPPVAPVLQSTSSVMESTQRSSEQSRASPISDNTGVSQIPLPDDPELKLSTSGVLPKLSEQPEDSRNSDNESLPQVPAPDDSVLQLSTSVFLPKLPEKSEASSNSDNEGLPQVPHPSDPEAHLSTTRVLQKSPEQFEAEHNSDDEERPQVPPPVAPVRHQSTSNVMKGAQRSSEKPRVDNFLRMSRLIMECGMPLLRRFIIHKAQEKGEGIDAILQKNKSKLLRQLHKELKKVVFPQSGDTNLNDWDFSTISIVLLLVFRPFLSQDEKDAINTIKSVRDNIYAHTNTVILRVDYYERNRKDVKEAIETLRNKLDISTQDEFRTILNDCENGPIGDKQSIEQTIETQFNELRADMKKTIREECKKLIKEGKIMKKCKVIEAAIKISGKEEDTRIIELAHKTIMEIFNKAVKRSGASEIGPLEKAVQEIIDGINDMTNAKVIEAISGSIIMKIEVSSNETLLDSLKYIEGESMNEKLEAVTDELVKSKQLKPSCSVSAAVSQHTLLSLYGELASHNEGNEWRPQLISHISPELYQSTPSVLKSAEILTDQYEGKKQTQLKSVPETSAHTGAAAVIQRTATAAEKTSNQTQVEGNKVMTGGNIETGKKPTQLPLPSIPTTSAHTGADAVHLSTATAEENIRQQSDSQTPNQTQVEGNKVVAGENIETSNVSLFSRQLMPELKGLVPQESAHTTGASPRSLETSLPNPRVRKPEKSPITGEKIRHILSTSRCSIKPGKSNVGNNASQFVKKSDIEVSSTQEEKIKHSNDDNNESGHGSLLSRHLMPELKGLVSQDSTHTTGALSGSLETSLPCVRVRKPEKSPITGKKPASAHTGSAEVKQRTATAEEKIRQHSDSLTPNLTQVEGNKVMTGENIETDKEQTQLSSVPTTSAHTEDTVVHGMTTTAEEKTRQNSDSQTPNQTQVEGNAGVTEENIETEPNEIKGMTFYQVLQTLGLADKYPGKITMQNLIAVDPNETNEIDRQCVTLTDIPWMILKRLICAHSEARDISVSDEDSMDLDDTIAFISESPKESQDISPLDIFIVVFQCCDPLLKQILFQKLYLCKIAVPFLYRSWETKELHQTMLAVWPLRSLAIENHVTLSDSRSKTNEVNVLELTSHVLAFARFGRPKYSKSKLLNSLLSSEGCKTFFNNECPSGMTTKYLSDGHIEMFWLPKVGGNKDRFQDAMTFLNMRGDIKGNFNVDILTFIARFVDTIAIVMDSESIMKQAKEVKGTVLNFSSIILIITNPLGPIIQSIENFKRDVISSKPGINLRVISTYKGVVEQNNVAMVSCISKYITDQIKSAKTKSYQERLSSYKFDCTKNDIIKTDEDDQSFQSCKVEAKKLVEQMKLDSNPSKWKKALTPVHCNYSQQLGTLMKKRERETDFDKGVKIDSEMETIRQCQARAITKTVKQFLEILIRESHFKLKIFLSWLHFYIEQEKRQVLPQLMHESRCAWEKLKTLKCAEVQVQSEIEKQETVIIHLEEKIDEASFSVEHLFREVGHIYDAILTLGEIASELGLPPTDQIANIIGHLVVDGHQLELIDGDSFYMPHKWTEAVLQDVDRYIGSCKVMTLSVLGVQSSGKSTLLNTMFGSQFSTRTGRCTRGIHVQLIPVTTASLNGFVSPFNYILIVDTEGLRSPELSHVQHEHDNELATVITGLGDVTMLNVMGENAGEIRDILQVIVHAFLRLQMTNRNLDMRKCCTFIHQNVSDSSAPEKMISGLSKLMQTLDEMTKESAQSEGILDITTFNQVIEFDIKSHVWYLKNLWQGNPPMARVNNEYSERVVDMKCKVVHRALTMKDKSYKALTDTITHAHSLWKGVLNEDFVFSFRNSLEIRAYMEMERVVQDQLWHLENFICENSLDISQNKFAGCDKEDELRSIANKLIKDLNVVLAYEKCKTGDNIAAYFEKNKYKDITIQWKQSQQCRIEALFITLKKSIQEQIEKRLAKRSVEILTVASREIHEEKLRKKSMKVANQYKGVELSETQITKLFDKIWQSFINKIDTTTCITENTERMQDIFGNCLSNRFNIDHALLKKSKEQSSYLNPMPGLNRLEGSFVRTGINNDDVGSKWFVQKIVRKGKEMFKCDNTTENVSESIDQIFVTTDNKIKQKCQVNDEITENDVKNLMQGLDTSLHAIPTEKAGYKFKTSFYVKVHVHVSRHVHPIFERHNEMYFKTKGNAVRLEQYRQQQKISFEAHLSNRRSEDIVAKLFSHVIEGFAEEWTSQNLPNKVTDELYSKLPSVKNRIIIEICSDLLDKGSFEHFIRYIRGPKDYATLWITEQANNYLFSGESRAYARIANSLLNSVFAKVETCLNDIKTSSTGKQSPSMEVWIHDFHVSLKEANLSVPPENFRNVKKEQKLIENVEYLTNKILVNLAAAREKVCSEYSNHGSGSVIWTGENPIERIIKKIWGCPEQCAFCGEPCAKPEDHGGSVHYSIQHRPSCCIGTRHKTKVTAFLTACEFNIQSKYTHNCPAFSYACNKETRKDCAEYHPYRDYKTFLPEWDIPPSSNMHDTSTFWMWFVATYKQDLHKLYQYKVDNIPTSWNEITKEQARESLNKIYSA